MLEREGRECEFLLAGRRFCGYNLQLAPRREYSDFLIILCRCGAEGKMEEWDLKLDSNQITKNAVILFITYN